MSRTHINVEFSALVEDRDHWPQNDRDFAEDTRGVPVYVHAQELLWEAMWEAGEEFIRQHREWFDGGLV